MLTIFDHNSPCWAERNTGNNGALSYSQDIVEFQIPRLIDNLPKDLDIIISTAPKLSQTTPEQTEFDVAIQYLHTYSYANPLSYLEEIITQSRFTAKKWLFITAYKSFADHINAVLDSDYRAIYIPMAINTEKAKKCRNLEETRYGMVYFGNLYMNKSDLYDRILKAGHKMFQYIDLVSFQKLNMASPLSTQEQAWDYVSRYQYGIGVGRCAMEMMAMGMKVMIAGAEFGGIATNEIEWELQRQTNFNGRIVTYNRDIETCIQAKDKIYVPTKENLLSLDISNRNDYLYLKQHL